VRQPQSRCADTDAFSFVHHPQVTVFDTLERAVKAILTIKREH
jgi:hypothetical protein